MSVLIFPMMIYLTLPYLCYCAWRVDRSTMLKHRAHHLSNEDKLLNMTVWDLYPNLDTMKQWFPPLPSLAADATVTKKQRQCGILWFYHIPKCGGTAVGEWLGRMRDYGYFDDVVPLMSMDHLIHYTKFEAQNLNGFLDNPQGRLIAIHHHHRGPGLFGFDATFDRIQSRLQTSGCMLMRATFLREPIARWFSAFFYNLGDDISDERTHEKFHAIVSDVSKAEYHNGELRYILNNKMNEYGQEPYVFDAHNISDAVWKDSKHEANKILRSFEFVGKTEHLADGVAAVASLIGAPQATSEVPLQTVNSNPHGQKIDKTWHDKVGTANQFDLHMFDDW